MYAQAMETDVDGTTRKQKQAWESEKQCQQHLAQEPERRRRQRVAFTPDQKAIDAKQLPTAELLTN